jgi:hypothetical protein
MLFINVRKYNSALLDACSTSRLGLQVDVTSSQICLAISLKAFLVLIALPQICSKCVFELHSISALLHPNDFIFRRALPAMV